MLGLSRAARERRQFYFFAWRFGPDIPSSPFKSSDGSASNPVGMIESDEVVKLLMSFSLDGCFCRRCRGFQFRRRFVIEPARISLAIQRRDGPRPVIRLHGAVRVEDVHEQVRARPRPNACQIRPNFRAAAVEGMDTSCKSFQTPACLAPTSPGSFANGSSRLIVASNVRV